MNIALEVRDLACVRGQRALFAGVNFSLAAGRMLSVEGPNGAGKTSLLRIIAGFLRPAAGTIHLRTDGEEIADAEERGKFIGWLGHQDAVKPQLNVREQLAFFARFYASGRDPDDAMRTFGLMPLAELPGQYLSAGQKRRLALARLQLSARPMWLLDEPLAALDAAGKKLVAETVTAHCASGGVVVAATHEATGRGVRETDIGGEAMTPFFALLSRDIRLAVRAGGGAALALAFFACVVTLVPLGVGADLRLLARIAGGVLWVAAVLAALLSLDRLFQADYEDGSLDLIVLSPLSAGGYGASPRSPHTGSPPACR